MVTFGSVTGFIVWEVRQLGQTLEQLHSSLVPLPSLIAELKGDHRRISLAVSLKQPVRLQRAVEHMRLVDKAPERFSDTLGRIRVLLSTESASKMRPRLKARLTAIAQQHRLMQGHIRQFFKAVADMHPGTKSSNNAVVVAI